MPDREKLNFILGRSVDDLRSIRVQGLGKPFEELTISELVQLRPGSEVADSYNVNAFTDNISASTSSILEELGQIQRLQAMNKVVAQDRLDQLRPKLGGLAGGTFGPRSADEPGPDEVKLPIDLNKDPYQA